MIRALAVVRRLCPHAKPEYLAAFANGEDHLTKAEVTTPLRLAHFLAQVLHETDGLTILTESLSYSAKRMTEVWPSRFPTIASARPYAHNPKALAEKTYGGRMGNGEEGSGDGWRYIGRGLIQCTGRSSYQRFGATLGIDLVGNPDLAFSAEWALPIALAEWTATGCNALADRNAIADITRKINGGLIGYKDRVAWFNKIWPVVQEMDGADPSPSWMTSQPDEDIVVVQKMLVAAGADIEVDGRKGKETVNAIKAFQKAHGLFVDGLCGEKTRAVLLDVVSPVATKSPKAEPPKDPPKTAVPGLSIVVAAQGGQELLDKVALLQSLADIPGIKVAIAALTVVGVGLIAWGIVAPIIAASSRQGAPS